MSWLKDSSSKPLNFSSLTQLSNSLYGSSRKPVSMYRTLLEYFLFVWIFSCFVGEGKYGEPGGMGLPGLTAAEVLSLWLVGWANKGKVYAPRAVSFVFVIYFSINQATMRIDLINQIMQIDAGNDGVNAWMFRVISGVRTWRRRWELKNNLSHLPRKMKLKLVKIWWWEVCRCAVNVF